MREAELQSRLETMLGEGYAGSQASTVVLQELESRTVGEALVTDVPCKKIWRVVQAVLGLSETTR